VVALCADLIGSLKMDAFVAISPSGSSRVGIAEANMMAWRPAPPSAAKFPGTFANFSTGRVQ
jgi:transketolase